MINVGVLLVKPTLWCERKQKFITFIVFNVQLVRDNYYQVSVKHVLCIKSSCGSNTWKGVLYIPNLSSVSILISIHHLFSVRLFLCPGDEFALRDGGSLYCKEDHDVLEKSQTPGQTTLEPNNNNITSNNNNTSLSNNNHSSELGSMSGENRIIRKELLNTPDHPTIGGGFKSPGG